MIGKMNKRGAELGDSATMLFMFGFILFVIVGGIALAFSFFYGSPLDYRYSDASLLYTKVARCLNENSLNDSFFGSLYKYCGIAENVITDEKMIISISGAGKTYFVAGDPIQCQLQDKNDNYPRCVIQTDLFMVNGQRIDLQIIAGSNQEARTQ